MEKTAEKHLPEGSLLINIPKVTDSRGSLCFLENSMIPFEIKRVFWIFNVPEGKTRGGHAHNTCAEVIFPVSGSFDILVDNGRERTTITLDSPNTGIYIAPSVWCHLKNFSPDVACVVMASHEYSAEGYVNDYNEYIRLKNGTDTL